ncbi:MarR family winged helix-turn-helix transcriptional regulator [Fodinicola acaciae]|uniref:MarR family winged helix-turn-helix transcriptional regulator n=1 Tax=Fodinicola acaciae TaxID=2681555 RepID=UPI0013CFA436|nr:MarR family transcriptional regulator [Fodinicola acaciae]
MSEHDSIARVLAGWRANRPDLQVDPIAVTARLARLRTKIGAELERVFASHGLTGPGFAVLATIVRLGGRPLSQKRLMAELDLTAGTVSVRIDRLVKDQLVVRRPDPADGRGCLVELTKRGRAAFEACAPEHLANARNLLAGITEQQREQLSHLLGLLLQSLEKD